MMTLKDGGVSEDGVGDLKGKSVDIVFIVNIYCSWFQEWFIIA